MDDSRKSEYAVVVLFGCATLCAIGFIVIYAVFSPNAMPNELLGLSLGLCLLCIGAAVAVIGLRLVSGEEQEHEYPPEQHPQAQQEILEELHAGGERITRKRMLLGAGSIAGCALTTAALTPVLSIGPFWDTGPLDRAPWKRGTRLVDEEGHPLHADDVIAETFYTAFPEGANMEDLGSPIVVLHLDPAKIKLPPGRSGWAPHGIIAYSKICTHAGCAVALLRKPTFPVLEPGEALVCPCHYSTFDPYTGATVLYGPAGRPLPQLPLEIDANGYLRAAGNFSGRVGPAWWNVLERPT